MKKQEERKEFRVLGRMLAEEISRETLTRAQGGKVSCKIVGTTDVPDVGQ